MHADLPWLLDLYRLAHFGGYRPTDLLGFAAAHLFRDLLAFLNNDIFTLLLGYRDALLLLVDTTDLLGKLLARLVTALGEWHLNVTTNLGQGMAHFLLNLLADLLRLINANIFPDRSTHFHLLLMAFLLRLLTLGLLGLLGSQGIQNMGNLVTDRPLPLLGGLNWL